MRATHKGSCQCCGAVQMLPGGVLAKHGYTTRWGFFDGVCQGSGFQAFEKGHDRIEDFIRWAEGRRASMEAARDQALEAPAEGTTEAWVHVYRSGNNFRKSGYEWMRRTVTFKRHDYSDGTGFFLIATYENPDKPGRTERIDLYDLGLDERRNPLAWIASLNRKYATAVDKDVAKVNEYIRWQERRIAEWKEQPLLPR